jgi:hypothetical protein
MRAGNFALARFNSIGGLDPTFGTNGLVDVDFFGGADDARVVAIRRTGASSLPVRQSTARHRTRAGTGS